MSHPKLARPDHDIHELIRDRWSPRAFDAARTVPRGELLRLFEAARWAPSSGNEQPWRFVVVTRDESSPVWRALVNGLTGANQAWATAAPVLVVAVVRLAREEKGTVNPMAWYDAGQAVSLMVVQATAQGLSVRQMAGFSHETIRQACGIPEGFDPAVIVAIGYAGDPEALPLEKHREAERQPRRRKPLTDIVFENNWGTGLISTGFNS
jgi:nitroreductase